MYIKASLVPKYVNQLAKSTLFKLIHDKKVRAIILDRQYYIYWPDLRVYLEDTLLVDIENMLRCSLDNLSTQQECLSITDMCRELGIDARKWKGLLKQKISANLSKKECRYVEKGKVYPIFVLKQALLDLQQEKQKEYDEILAVIARWQQEHLSNNRFFVFPMPTLQNRRLEYPGILIKHLVES